MKGNNKTEILKVKGDWTEIVDDCRATVKKSGLGREPSAEFKKRILISEHSPIRDMMVKFKWANIKYWVAMHWKTHHWESRVDSQRNDRQARYDREKAGQDAPVDFIGDVNIQHTIDTWRKRLCYQASPETRQYAEDFKRTLHEIQPEWADVLVPNCVYRFGCPEMNTCGYWNRLVKESGYKLVTDDIQTRYDVYNKIFYGEGEEDCGNG
jgi:hypothetical protein